MKRVGNIRTALVFTFCCASQYQFQRLRNGSADSGVAADLSASLRHGTGKDRLTILSAGAAFLSGTAALPPCVSSSKNRQNVQTALLGAGHRSESPAGRSN
jgi:hypothetical protein